MNIWSIENGPPDELIEQSILSPEILRKLVGDLGEPDAPDKIERLASMNPFSLIILRGRERLLPSS